MPILLWFHVGTTLHNIVGIALADVCFRVFKRLKHVGQRCFYGNTEENLGLIFTLNSLRNYNFVTFVDEYRRWKTRKCICHLENTPTHINKNRELKQRGRERQRERYKTIDLITEYTITSCGNATTWLVGHRRTKEMLAYVGQNV